MENKSRTIFFVSDSTGITAQTLGYSLLSQFEELDIEHFTWSYIKDKNKALEVIHHINQISKNGEPRPVVFATLSDVEIRYLVSACNALFIDLLGTFISPLEREFGIQSSHAIGRSHSIRNKIMPYDNRIEAINFALQHDDGASLLHYQKADTILVGVSRSGKTPTCVFLATQFGIKAANFPLTEEDAEDGLLPQSIRTFKQKVFGLTINAERLQQIRQERRPNSRYATLVQCSIEVQQIENLYRRLQIPYVDTTSTSIEEIAALIMQKIDMPQGPQSRRAYQPVV